MATLSRTAPHGQTDVQVNREELLRPWPKISFKAIGIIVLIVAAFS